MKKTVISIILFLIGILGLFILNRIEESSTIKIPMGYGITALILSLLSALLGFILLIKNLKSKYVSEISSGRAVILSFISSIFNWFESWFKKHPLKGLFIGIGGLAPILILGILDDIINISYFEFNPLIYYPMFMAAFACFFFGVIYSFRALYILSQRGYSWAGLIAGTTLIIAGIGISTWSILNLGNLAKPMEGSVVKVGPILVPGGIIAFVPFIIGTLVIFGGISFLIGTYSQKKR
jgi:hypothetical protein